MPIINRELIAKVFAKSKRVTFLSIKFLCRDAIAYATNMAAIALRVRRGNNVWMTHSNRYYITNVKTFQIVIWTTDWLPYICHHNAIVIFQHGTDWFHQERNTAGNNLLET